MDRTVIVHLKPTSEQAKILTQTMREHTSCFNAVAQLGFTTKCSNGIELHKQTYYDLRGQFPNLPAQLVCRACGYTLNADLNASRNIREKHARLGRPLASGLPSSSLSFPPSGEVQAPGF